MDFIAQVLVVLLVIAIGIVILLLNGVLARSYVERSLPALESEISDALGKWQNANQKSDKYRPHLSEEPYASAGRQLPGSLSDWKNDLTTCETETLGIKQSLAQKPTDLIRIIPEVVFVWPFRWISSSFQIRNIRQRVQNAQVKKSAVVDGILARLETQPDELLKLVKNIQDKVLETAAHLGALEQANVQGDELAQVRKEQETLQHLLVQAKQQLEQSKQPLAVVEVYRSLGEAKAQPRSETLQSQAGQWRERYTRAKTSRGHLEEALKRVLLAEQSIPDILDTENLNNQVKQVQTYSEALFKRFAAPTPSDLGAIIQQAGELRSKADRLAAALNQDLDKFKRLNESIQTVAEKADEVKLQYDQALDLYPVIWDVSQSSLDQAVKAVQELVQRQNALQKITPQQVEQSHVEAARLSETLEALSKAQKQVVFSRENILGIAGRSQSILKKEWIESARQLARQVQPYAAANWLETGHPKELEQEAEKLLAQRRALLPTEQKVIYESDIPQRLNSAEIFVNSLAAFEPRLKKAQQKWVEMQQQEVEARQALMNSTNAFARLSADPDFERLPGDSAKQIAKMLHQATGYQTELDRTQDGSVQSKAQKIAEWSTNLLTLSRALFDALETEIERKRELLGQRVNQIQENIAPLTLEETYRKAQTISQKPGPVSPTFSRVTELAGIAPNLEKLADEYHEISQALKDFARLIENPLQDPYNQTLASKEKAEKAKESVLSLIPENRKWPPTSVDKKAVEKVMSEVNEYWQSRVKVSSTIPKVTACLEEATRLYGQATAQLQRLRTQITTDHDNITQLEASLDERRETWRTLRKQFGNDPAVYRQISGLLTKLGNSRDIRSSRGSSRPNYYASVLDELTALLKLADEAAIEINTERLNGRLTIAGFQKYAGQRPAPKNAPPRSQISSRDDFRDQLASLVKRLGQYRQYDEYVPEAIRELGLALDRARKAYPDIAELRRYLNSAESILSRIDSPPDDLDEITDDVVELAEIVSQVYRTGKFN